MQLNLKLKFLFLFFLVIFTNLPAQKSSNTNFSNEEIEKKIDDNINNPAKMWELINLYILKSKREQNTEALFYAYRYRFIDSLFDCLVWCIKEKHIAL